MTTSMMNFINQYSDAQKVLHAEKRAAFDRFEENISEPGALDIFRSELRAAMMHFEKTLKEHYEENHRPTFLGAAA
jgi:hypothetical protein